MGEPAACDMLWSGKTGNIFSMDTHWCCFITYESFPVHWASFSLVSKALFQTISILNKQGGKENRCAEVKQCIKSIWAGETPHISHPALPSCIHLWLQLPCLRLGGGHKGCGKDGATSTLSILRAESDQGSDGNKQWQGDCWSCSYYNY